MATNLFEEMTRALAGTIALVRGDRRAPGYFDFTARGLAGSFIAFAVIVGFQSLLFGATENETVSFTAFQGLILSLSVATLHYGVTAIVLNQTKRLDAFVPYLVANNWASLFSVATVVLAPFGLLGMLITLTLLLIVEINIMRLIMTLNLGQIITLLVAQIVAVILGAMVMLSILLAPLATQ